MRVYESNEIEEKGTTLNRIGDEQINHQKT